LNLISEGIETLTKAADKNPLLLALLLKSNIPKAELLETALKTNLDEELNEFVGDILMEEGKHEEAMKLYKKSKN